jgi:hypothetical protein
MPSYARALAAHAAVKVKDRRMKIVSQGDSTLIVAMADEDSHAPKGPLTEEQINTMIEAKHFRKGYIRSMSENVNLGWYRLGLREGERAHGIVSTTSEGEQA